MLLCPHPYLFLRRHGGATKCNIKGCTSNAQAKGKCKVHGAYDLCKVKSCKNKSRASHGLCKYTYTRTQLSYRPTVLYMYTCHGDLSRYAHRSTTTSSKLSIIRQQDLCRQCITVYPFFCCSSAAHVQIAHREPVVIMTGRYICIYLYLYPNCFQSRVSVKVPHTPSSCDADLQVQSMVITQRALSKAATVMQLQEACARSITYN